MKLALLNPLPSLVLAVTSLVFNALTLRNTIIQRRRKPDGSDQVQSKSHVNKHLILSASSSLTMLFGSLWSLIPLCKEYFANMSDHEYYPLFVPITQVMKTIHWKIFFTRFIIDSTKQGYSLNLVGFLFTVPLTGIYFFCLFGLGKEARRMHRDHFNKFIYLLHRGRRTTGDQDHEGETKPSRQSWNFPKRLPLFNRRADPLVTPLQLPIVVSYPLEMGSKSNLGVARNMYLPTQVDISHSTGSSTHEGADCIPSPSDTARPFKEKSQVALLQAPPPAYVLRPTPSKSSW
ncbi:hypothetical protein CPB86DRAFT_454584 [Serendipita vermifera]|nr:hypothetical protein CPB86DRAFT_454584 [Serendipita vermifera]